MSDAIATFDLTKQYGNSRGITSLNLHVEQGEIFGFLGPNGAGKSTTLRTLLGYMKPTSGRAEVLGLDSQANTVEIHARTGVLPGEFTLDDRMTGRQLIALFARLRGISDLSFSQELARRFEADLDRPMRRLSRGNKQKIGLIQAFFHRPELIVLDEPTGGLDPLMQETFLALLEEARERGQTVFFSSHILAEIERVADCVGIIRDGKLVAVEDPSQLTGRSLRHYRIEFAEPLDAASEQLIRALPSVTNVAFDGAVVTFSADAAADQIVKLAAKHTVASIDVERPTLEEIFLTYYGQREQEAA